MFIKKIIVVSILIAGIIGSICTDKVRVETPVNEIKSITVFNNGNSSYSDREMFYDNILNANYIKCNESDILNSGEVKMSFSIKNKNGDCEEFIMYGEFIAHLYNKMNIGFYRIPKIRLYSDIVEFLK